MSFFILTHCSDLTKYCHTRLADGCSKMILSGVDGHICQSTPCITQTNTCTATSPSPLRQPRSLLLISFTSHCAPAPHRLSMLKSALRPERSDWSTLPFYSVSTLIKLQQVFHRCSPNSWLDSANDWYIFFYLFMCVVSVLVIWFMKQWTPGKQQHGDQTYVALQHDSRLQ